MSMRQLQTLLAARQRHRDAQRQQLARLLRERSALAEQHRRLGRQLDECLSLVRDPSAHRAQAQRITAAFQFAARLRERRTQLAQSIADLRSQIAAVRRVLLRLEQDVELLSGVRQRRARALQARQLTDEQRSLDDSVRHRPPPGCVGPHGSQFHS